MPAPRFEVLIVGAGRSGASCKSVALILGNIRTGRPCCGYLYAGQLVLRDGS